MSRLTRRIPDEALVLRVRRGDQRAVRTLFDRHGGAAYSLGYAICGEQATAELAVRDALLELWREGCFGEAALADVNTWLLRATRAAAIRAIRGRNGGSQQATVGVGVGGRTALGRRAQAPQIQRALAMLPDATRRAIELAYLGGADECAIAATLALAPGTARQRLSEGLHALSDALETFQSTEIERRIPSRTQSVWGPDLGARGTKTC